MINPASAAADGIDETTAISSEAASSDAVTGTTGLSPEFTLPQITEPDSLVAPAPSTDDLSEVALVSDKSGSDSGTTSSGIGGASGSSEPVLSAEQQSLSLAGNTNSSSLASNTYYIDPNDPADLEALINAPNPVFPASNFTYVVTVTNHGPDPAVNVTQGTATGFDSLLLLTGLALLDAGIITVFLSPMPAAVFRRKR